MLGEAEGKRFRRPQEHGLPEGGSSTRSRTVTRLERQPRWLKESPTSKGSDVTLASEQSNLQVERVALEPQVPSEEGPNELGAQIIRAELAGNVDLAARLQARLEAVRQQPSVVVLTQSTSSGLTRPLQAPASHYADAASRKKKCKVETHDASGKRRCYFGDDDRYSLGQMFQTEKFRTLDDDMATYLRMAAKGGRGRDLDDLFEDECAVQESESERQRKEIQRAIRDEKQVSAVLGRCAFCLEGKGMQKHLIVAMGSKAYLALPERRSLVEGHCFIVPMTHVAACTMLDEDVWLQMQEFRTALNRLFQSRGCEVLYLESSLQLRRHPHTCVECIPLPSGHAALAPMYFKKAILECETEWTENKKLVDLSQRDVRRAVPRGLPYFAVTFAWDGTGFAHVVEDEKLFPSYFGQEIVGGLLELEPQSWLKPARETFQQQCRKVLQFSEWWKPHDFTHSPCVPGCK